MLLCTYWTNVIRVFAWRQVSSANAADAIVCMSALRFEKHKGLLRNSAVLRSYAPKLRALSLLCLVVQQSQNRTDSAKTDSADKSNHDAVPQVLMGHSMGAACATSEVLSNPKVNSNIFITGHSSASSIASNCSRVLLRFGTKKCLRVFSSILLFIGP